MADNKKSVLLYCDIIHTVKKLIVKDRDKGTNNAGELFYHYLQYINDLNPDPISDIVDITFEPIKQNLKRDLKSYEEKCVKNSMIAKEGWKKRKEANASERIKSNAKHADIDKGIDTDKDKGIDIKKKKYNFRKSLLDYGFNEDLIISWLEIRKKKKAVNSEIAFKGFIREIEKVNYMPIDAILKTIIEKSWSGFDAAWIKSENNGKQQTNYEAIKTFGDDFLNRQNQDSGNGG